MKKQKQESDTRVINTEKLKMKEIWAHKRNIFSKVQLDIGT